MNAERFSSFVLFIERISKNIKRVADIKLEPYGLRSSHLMCILQLAKSEGGLSSTGLAEACGVDKAFVSRITGELVEKNYIVKKVLVTFDTMKVSFAYAGTFQRFFAVNTISTFLILLEIYIVQ